MKRVLLLLIFVHSHLNSAITVCPGGKFECPKDHTCCKLDDNWGCCPFQNGVCCSHQSYCCPSGQSCNDGLCQQLYLNNSQMINAEKLGNSCPGGKYYCPGDSTCCKVPKTETFGCCLLPKAVCCSDGQSCCPEESVCDPKHSQCVPKNNLIKVQNLTTQVLVPLRYKLDIKNLNSGFSKINYTKWITCNGNKVCHDYETCCSINKLKTEFACCPFENGTCCRDFKHCCPNGALCTDKGYCL